MNTGATGGSVVMICPNLKCRRVLQVPSKFRGQHVKCRYCSLTFAVPQAKAEVRPVEKNEEEPADSKDKNSKKDASGKGK